MDIYIFSVYITGMGKLTTNHAIYYLKKSERKKHYKVDGRHLFLQFA